MALDLFTPLAALMDAIAAATGYDVRAMVANGFKHVIELSRWGRIKAAGSAVLGAAGGAFTLLTKLKQLKNRAKQLVEGYKAKKQEERAQAARQAAVCGSQRSPTIQCFVAGTLVLTGAALGGEPVAEPIEDLDLGDSVYVALDLPGREDAHLDEFTVLGNADCEPFVAIDFERVSPGATRLIPLNPSAVFARAVPW